jgi:hypothetical protein
MTNFANAFAGAGNKASDTTEGSSNSSGFQGDDFKRYYQGIVDTCGTQTKSKSVVGVISGIVWLGKQPMEPAKMLWTGTPEEEAAELEKSPTNWFENIKNPKTNKMERFKRWPQGARDAVAFTIDFPRFMVDSLVKEGETPTKHPVRMLLNGKFIHKGSHPKDAVLGKVYDLQWKKTEDNQWTINQKSLVYKIAVATGVINNKDVLRVDDLGKLIGKHAQFEMQAFLNEGGYFDEKISFKGPVPEELVEMGLPALDEKFMYFVRFDAENDESHIKQLRSHVVNQILKAEDYPTSVIRPQIEKVFPWTVGKLTTEAQSDDKAPVNTNVQGNANTPPSEAEEGTDDGINFDDMESSDPF